MLAGLRGGASQGNCRYLNAGAGDRRPLVGGGVGVAQHHLQACHRNIQFFGDDLGQRGLDARTQIHVAVEGKHVPAGRV
ncbi:hypothetical protein G6F22_019359 [Rhizopus arrhizus]|nr:hypothetical protein G6F22_019359 [Rhizopus arrhizus]KAG1487917.1 hypothetical protein G6F52_014073 [Rhizopus delemar]